MSQRRIFRSSSEYTDTVVDVLLPSPLAILTLPSKYLSKAHTETLKIRLFDRAEENRQIYFGGIEVFAVNCAVKFQARKTEAD
jgi:hypothetical protein